MSQELTRCLRKCYPPGGWLYLKFATKAKGWLYPSHLVGFTRHPPCFYRSLGGYRRKSVTNTRSWSINLKPDLARRRPSSGQTLRRSPWVGAGPRDCEQGVRPPDLELVCPSGHKFEVGLFKGIKRVPSAEHQPSRWSARQSQ